MNSELNEKDTLDALINLALKSGELALEIQLDPKPRLKHDSSVVTEADLAITELIKADAKFIWERQDTALIDEESDHTEQPPEKIIGNNTKYILAVDPIDGTRPFANSLPTYGVSIGLLKENKPWLGVVFFPSLGELFYADSSTAWFEKRCGTNVVRKEQITPQALTLGPEHLFYGSDAFTSHKRWKSKYSHMVIAGCAIVNLCFPSINRGSGSVFRAHLWDYAGSWPVLNHAGLGLFGLRDGKQFLEIGVNDFSGKSKFPWLLKQGYICCREEHFETFKGCIIR